MKKLAYERNINARRDHYNEMSKLKARRSINELKPAYINKILKMRDMKEFVGNEQMQLMFKSLLKLKRAIQLKKETK